MSTHEAVSPLHVVTCDAEGCEAEFRPICNFDKRTPWGARYEAADAGWQVRPRDGRGSRTAPDLCPRHASTEDGTR
ncbi:hypothetical protein [Micromonospora rubida]